jgi:hypothetical protein
MHHTVIFSLINLFMLEVQFFINMSFGVSQEMAQYSVWGGTGVSGVSIQCVCVWQNLQQDVVKNNIQVNRSFIQNNHHESSILPTIYILHLYNLYLYVHFSNILCFFLHKCIMWTHSGGSVSLSICMFHLCSSNWILFKWCTGCLHQKLCKLISLWCIWIKFKACFYTWHQIKLKNLLRNKS